MLDTQLILIEGLPGSGKSTTAEYLATKFQSQGIRSRWFHEMDDDNPIADLPCDMAGYQSRMIDEWARLVEQTRSSGIVTVLESRFWQNSALFMYMGTYSEDEVLAFNGAIAKTIQPLSPVLFYLVQDDVRTALNRLYDFRGAEWMEEVIEATTKEHWFQSRDLGGFEGWMKFFEEWNTVAEKLYKALEFRKCKIHNAHDDWARAYTEMHSFLGL